MSEWLICGFGLFTLACALVVVLANNPIFSALGLLFSFFGLAVLYLLWGSAFLSVIQILVYAGAVVVLFVFVVMLLDMNTARAGRGPGWAATLLVTATGWTFSLFLLRILNRGNFSFAPVNKALGSVNVVSNILFHEYLWPFEILSVFLLAVIIAAYCLARPEELDKPSGEKR